MLVGAVAGLGFFPHHGESSKWKTLEDCQLLANESNDGDSFHVKADGKQYIFRLYFVDTPETDETLPDRVKTQAEYWHVTPHQAVHLGEEAREFTAKFLRGRFTVLTCLDDAMGRSRLPRYYALVKSGDQDLGLALVSNGLARIYGEKTDLPDGTRAARYIERLERAEREARREVRGGWALAGRGMTAAESWTAKITEQDVTLSRAVPVFSTNAPAEITSYLLAGTRVTVLRAEPPNFVRIRYATLDGQFREGLCHRPDLKP